MTKQLSNCCKAEIELTGLDHPNAFKCKKCGRIIGTEITPPVNESWEEELEEFGDLHGQYCGVNREEECDCKELADLKKFVRTLLSTARQEAKEELGGSIGILLADIAYAMGHMEGCGHEAEYLKNKYPQFIDSLTSKGGTT